MEMSVRSPLAASSNGSGPADLEVAVIGAGPHGLAATAHLRRAGVQAQLFGRPLAFWKSMPEGMVLRSNLRASHLIEPTGPLSVAEFAAASGVQLEQPVLLENFIAYGTWVQQMAVPDVDERTVQSLDRDQRAFTLQLQDGERVRARRVVLACGIEPFQSMPPGYDHLPADRVSHAGRYRDMSIFAGRRVALVGGGQSSFTCAALMRAHGAAEVEVLVRDDAVIWLRGHSVTKRLGRLGPILYAPTDVGPLWYSRLVATPALFRRLPRATQDRIAYRSIRPACSHVVRTQLGDVRISTGVEVLGADLDGDRAAGLAFRREHARGRSSDVRHGIRGRHRALRVPERGHPRRVAPPRGISDPPPRPRELGGRAARPGRTGGLELRADHALHLRQLVRGSRCSPHDRRRLPARPAGSVRP